MPRLSRWLRAPRTLPILLGIVVALPAVTLVVLGMRLLEQDRALARTRRGEILQSAADRAVRAVDQDISDLTRRLADPAWQAAGPAAGSIDLVITTADVRVEPASAIAWYPIARTLVEPPTAAFVELNAAEIQARDLPKALEISQRLAARPDPAIQAGALLAQASVLRKMGRAVDAAATYTRLAAITTVAVNGEPVDLLARRTMCALAHEQGRPSDLREAALRLQADLQAGRWRLDRVSYEYAAAQLDQWLGPDRQRDAGREALAAGVEWIFRQRIAGGRLAVTGAHSMVAEAGAVTVVWAAAPDRVAAMAALPAYIDRVWRANAERAASPAAIAFDDDGAGARRNGAPDGVEPAATRTALETGLPWTIVARLPPGPLRGEASREPTLLVALAAVLALAGAGTYLVVRARNQEIALSRLQSDFVGAVSHEFRTPLTALRQFNDLLDDEGGLPEKKRRDYHQAQTRATERLHRLVEALLDFGRMEAGRRPYTFEPVDAGALVRDLVDEFRAELDGRGFQIRCRIEPGDHVIQADTEALGRAIWNLLDNAVKYSGDGRDVDVTVGAGGGSHSGRAVAIAVRDRGIGIPGPEQARIFQKFVRGTSTTAAHIKGTGIGLAMAQHIVSAHGGRILLDSEPGQGSTFTIVVESRRPGL